MGQYISDRDVVRICSSEELRRLLDKFSTRDLDVDAEIMGSHKGNSSLGAALCVRLALPLHVASHSVKSPTAHIVWAYDERDDDALKWEAPEDRELEHNAQDASEDV